MTRSLYWHQGLFLQPQHFQHIEQQLSEQISQVWRAACGYFWGSISCQLDEAQLLNSTVVIKRGQFVLSDGTWLNVPDNADVEPLVVNQDHFANTDTVTVYLCLPKIQPYHANKGEGLRYSSQLEKKVVGDFFEGGDPIELDLVRMQASLRAGDEMNNDCSKLAIAQFRLVGDNIELDDSFVPTSVLLANNGQLTDKVETCLKELIERAKQFEEYKGGHAQGEFSNKIFRYRLALQTISRYAAELDHLLQSKTATPEMAFVCLKQLLSELSIFSQQSDILGRTSESEGSISYQHDQLGHTFSQVQKRLRALLNELSVAPENILRFERLSSGLLATNLPNDLLADTAPLYVIARTQVPITSWQTELLQFAKLGPSKLVPTLSARALPGMQLEYEAARPEGLPHRPNSHYFRLHQDPEFMQAIKQGDALALDWPNAPEDVVIELVQLKG